MRVNVLHVVHWPRSGITSLLYDLINGMTSPNISHGVFFFIGDSQEMNKFKNTCSFVRFAKGGSENNQYFKSLSSAIAEFKPDIIHTHSFLPLFYSRLITPSTNAIHTVHSEYPHLKKPNSLSLWLKQKIHLHLVRSSTVRTIVISDTIYQLLRSLGVNKNQLTKINNGVNLAKFIRPIESKQNHPMKRIIALGRLSEEKGFLNLINAFHKLIKINSFDIYLEIVGEGDQKTRIKSAIEKLKLLNRVRLVGFSSEPERLLTRSDVFVCSSLYEGFGLAIVEAMASGCLVVSSPVGVAKNIIKDDLAGILAKDNSVESLYLGLKKALSLEPKSIIDMKELATSEVGEKYSMSSMTKEYVKVYEESMP